MTADSLLPVSVRQYRIPGPAFAEIRRREIREKTKKQTCYYSKIC